jgi:hypothetical protein
MIGVCSGAAIGSVWGFGDSSRRQQIRDLTKHEFDSCF